MGLCQQLFWLLSPPLEESSTALASGSRSAVWRDLLEQQAQDYHVVHRTLLAGVVSQDRHEGEQEANKAILQYQSANGDLPMSHVSGATVF